MKTTNIILALVLAVFLAGFLAACAGAGETTLTGEEQEAVLAYSEAKTDNLMAGMNAGDYAAFSKDFDDAMLNAIPASGFEKLKQDRDDKLGKYVSREVSQVTQSGNYITVIYDAVFEKEPNVVMRVVFQAEDPHKISGLWFDK